MVGSLGVTFLKQLQLAILVWSIEDKEGFYVSRCIIMRMHRFSPYLTNSLLRTELRLVTIAMRLPVMKDVTTVCCQTKQAKNVKPCNVLKKNAAALLDKSGFLPLQLQSLSRRFQRTRCMPPVKINLGSHDEHTRRSFSPSRSRHHLNSALRGLGAAWIKDVFHIQSANRMDRIDWAVDGFLRRARVSAIMLVNGTGPDHL